MSLGQALGFLWRGRWWIAGFTMAGIAAGVLLAKQRGTVYRARAVLYVERETQVIPGGDVSLWMQSRNYANTQAALLKSTPILQAVLESPAIASSPVFGDSGNHLNWIKRNLTTVVGQLDDLITVTLDSPLRDDACNLVNAVVDQYLAFHAKNKRETASEVLTHLTGELQRYETELRSVQAEQTNFLAKHPGVGLSAETSTVAAERFRELNSAMNRAEVEMLDADTALRMARSLAKSIDVVRQLPIQGQGQITAGPTAEDERRLHELVQRRSELLLEVKPEHPEVKRLSTEIEELQQRTTSNDERLANAYIALFEHRYQTSKQKFDDLATKVGEQEQRLLAADPLLAEYRAIENRFERARKIADTLYERIRTLDINEGLANDSKLDALVYEYATPGSAAVAASKTALAAIAAFLGFVLGVGAAWFRSLLDQRLRTTDDVTDYLPLLGVVPRVATDPDDVFQTWRRSPEFAEAMRSLRTVIYFGVRSERSRTLQFTSAAERDGKSLTTAGLGIAMAQSGKRTLIIDADFYRSGQAKLFRIADKVGLVQVLNRKAAALTAVVETQLPNLHVLPAGTPTEAGEILDGGRLAEVLQEFSPHYDRILIDSPPLLPVADARIIAAVCDETVLVMRCGRTTKKLVETAMSLVASVGGRVSGAVLNWLPRAVSSSSYVSYSSLSLESARRQGDGGPRVEVATAKEKSANG